VDHGLGGGKMDTSLRGSTRPEPVKAEKAEKREDHTLGISWVGWETGSEKKWEGTLKKISFPLPQGPQKPTKRSDRKLKGVRGHKN